jgi:MoaA/NifB/PqqE/SkfB family radical SAM enzyme
MPRIKNKKIGVALDMCGCPNRCRHCYLGYGTNRKMSDDDLRWMADQFRDYIGHSGTLKSLEISSYFREPDFSNEYRHLHELARELSDEEPKRHELLSIWRLARDRDYAPWSKSVGPQTCQITIFGMETTTDWFYRRRGAFEDAIVATERLLEVGMKPRWQIFLTKKVIPELDELLRLIERLKLRKRVHELGSDFQLFIHTPGPLQEGRKIEYLRPTIEETDSIPQEILEASRRHLGRRTLWQTESNLYKSIIETERIPSADESLLDELQQFWFFVTDNWDVFSNAGTLEPWWKLGNMKEDSVATIMRRFERDEIPGLNILLHYPQKKLAEEFSNPEGRKVYSGRGDLLDLYLARHCEKTWGD